MALRLQRNKVATAVSLALAVTGASALAQDDTEREVEEIIVTGKYRASLIDSINTKRYSSSIVEAISAEDIGKLPDSSIAEAIARLPGLAGQRLDGRTSSISIRGLGEDFSSATLNGREQVSISDNRGIEFDLYPSEIMSGVTIYKTPEASLMTQGIGGTINLHTIRPLDHEQAIAVNAILEQNGHDQLNPDGDDSGWRGTFSWVDQFADDRLGVALAVATMKSPNQEERWNTWGFPTTGDGDLVLGGAKPFVRSSTLDRDTVMGVVQFDATEGFRITADALYIDFDDEKILRGIELPGAWTYPYDVVAAEDGLVTQGVWQGVRGQIRNDFEKRQAELRSFGLNVEYDVNANWTMVFDASQGKVDRDIWSLESYAGSGRSSDPLAPADDIMFDMNSGAEGGRFTPSLDYSDESMFQLGGAQGWGNNTTVPGDGQDGFINFPHVEDKLNTYRIAADGEVDLGFVTGIEFGLYYSDREKSKLDQGTFLTLPQYPGVAQIPSEYRLPATSLDFIGMGEMISYDSFAFWADGNYTETVEGLTSSNRAQNTWTVNEEVTIAYALARFDTDLGAIGLTGNIGLQVVDTDQSSDGFAVDIVDGFVRAQPVSGGADYTEVLPSLNTIFHLADEHQVRFGAARTMSRSRMDRMNASFGFSFDPTFNTPGADISASPWSGSGANPGLRPQMADQFDLTYEYYFADDGYAAAAVFHKELRDWQVSVAEVVDFSGIQPPGGQVATFDLGLVSRWENADGGSVRGVELQTALPGRLLAAPLEGFGLVASATFLDSSVELDGNEIQVPGLSDRILNLTLYYENGGFEARVSGNRRDDFLGEVYAISFSRELVNVKDTEIIDAQLSYDFSESGIEMLRGLTLTLQGQNLTNEPFVTYQNNDERQVRDFQNYGRNYLLGARFRFD
ncbi:MAG TPA: TonB-dependent receptor [Woeseiaceae bacterium]|nr:TonB-dependent receptor [Woeseiaceae bacterium]